ncbi:hypothetical protein OQA88_11566 [Cercophora sp. LCS_1]
MAVRTFLSLAGFAASVGAVSIEPSPQAVSWKHNDTDFWAPVHLQSAVHHLQSPAGTLPSSLSRRSEKSGDYLACTAATLQSDESLSAATLERIVASYTIDDVWSAEQFLDCLYVQYNGTDTKISVDASVADFVNKHDVRILLVSPSFDLQGFASTASVHAVVSPCDLDNGPYLVTLPKCDGEGMSATPVYTVHADHYDAFMESSIPDNSEPGKHQQLHVSLPGARLAQIITPSRLSSTKSGAGPLAGLRGSRSYYLAYGYQNYTTETVQLSLDAGAALVGKTKTIAFALGAPRNGMEVDYPNPWSARGDGYQNTGGSSSGSGSTVTAYSWLDFAIGSDTGGSVRFPARFGGFYGYKPTHGIFNITSILVAIAEQDMPGLMTRSPSIFTKLFSVWTKNKPLSPLPSKLPTKILRYTDQITNVTKPAAAALIEDYFTSLISLLSLSPASVNMTSSFLLHNISQSSPPVPPSEFMKFVYSDQNSIQNWEHIGKDLVSKFAQIPGQEGALPPADPPVNITWTDALNKTTIARYPESQRRREVFGDWFNQHVLPGNNETCSEYIFAHSYHAPPGTVKTDPATARLTGGWYDGVYTNYAGTPEIVLPVGQVEYWSAFTRRVEWQPVTVALGVSKGCDAVLFEIVGRLREAGLKETVFGRTAYPVE